MIQIIVNNKETDVSSAVSVLVDDTASMIKQKLSSQLKVSTEEMYLYLETTSTLSPQSVYSLLSKNRRIQVSVDLLRGFVENITNSNRQVREINELPKTEPVPYSFFESLFTENKEYRIKVPFGLSFGLDPINTDSIVDNVILPTNPYEAKRILRNKFMVLSNNEETLLSKLPPVVNNTTLHVCTVIETIQSYTFPSVGELVSLYFPKLASNLPSKLGASSSSSDYLEAIKTIRKDLFTQSEMLLRSNTKYYKNIEFWNNGRRFNEKEGDMSGITNMVVSYLSTPTLSSHLPIEFIFKSIHATENMPFVRYVITKRREQVVRLYSPTEAKDDKRIPFLSRALVNKILSKSKKNPGIGAFFMSSVEDLYIFIELKETGEIQLHLEAPNERPFLFTQFDLLENMIGEFVYIINDILKQTDIILQPVRNIIQNTQITGVDWILSFPFSKPPSEVIGKTKTKLGCSIFLHESIMNKEKGKKEKEKEKVAKAKSEMEFVYSRVSNFSVDNPKEIQTGLSIFYSVDTHRLSMKINNLPNFKYLQTVPSYVERFRDVLTNKDVEEEYKSTTNMSTYGYNKQKGEEEFQAELLEELREKEEEETAEEVDEFDKYIMERMKEIPESTTENKSEETEETEEELGDFDLDVDNETEISEPVPELEELEEEELGDFDEDL